MSRSFLSRLLAIALALTPGAASAGPLDDYPLVTRERLVSPEPGSWMLYRRSYDGHGYSPLDTINTTNVRDLTPVWTFSTGVGEGHEAPPIVNKGIMFVATPEAQVIALDAKTGDLLWRYVRDLPKDIPHPHATSRGVGLWRDKVYLATVDDHLVALDARSGAVVWDRKVQDYRKGQYMTLMPLVVDGKVIIGGSGAEFGVRGYVAAFDAETGKELWRTYTIPGPGEAGHETWRGDDWVNGGGSAWMTGNYDPALDLIYWGVGNPIPWPGDSHPGDNLYTTSIIALSPETGKIKAHFQYHPNDSWDWDEVEAPMLIDLRRDGRMIRSLVHPGRDAIFWVLERSADKIGYVAGWPFVYTDVWKSIDAQGRPVLDPAHKPAVGRFIEFCPSQWGGKNWPSAAYSPKTGLAYVPANENFCAGLRGVREAFKPGRMWLGVDPDDIGLKVRPGADHFGELQAWDPATGRRAWKHDFKGTQLYASALATAGNLVFIGGTNDRMFRAFDARTGDLLWSQKTNSGVIAAPVSYEIDGEQYIAVVSGWGVGGQALQSELVRNDVGVKDNVPQGGVVWVFALKRREPAN